MQYKTGNSFECKSIFPNKIELQQIASINTNLKYLHTDKEPYKIA